MFLFAIFLITQSIPIYQTLILDPQVLCDAKLGSKTDLNQIYGITSDSPYRFFNNVSLEKKDSFILWTIPQTIKFNVTDDTYQCVVDTFFYHDMELLLPPNFEIFSKINPRQSQIMKVCGVPQFTPIGLYGRLTGALVNETCVTISVPDLLNVDTITNIYINHAFNQVSTMLEFYPSQIVVFVLPFVNQLYKVTKIIFKMDQNSNPTTLTPSVLRAVVHNCEVKGNTSLHQTFSQYTVERFGNFPLNVKTLCNMVRGDDIVRDVIANQNNTLKVIKGVNLHKFDDVWGTFEGKFEKKTTNISQSISIFEPSMEYVNSVLDWQPLQINFINPFTISMPAYIDGACYITLRSGQSHHALYYTIVSYEKFNLTQTMKGVQGIISSHTYPKADIEAKGYIMTDVSCTTLNSTNLSLFDVSPNAKLRIRRKILDCV